MSVINWKAKSLAPCSPLQRTEPRITRDWPETEAEDADTMVFDRKTEVKHNYDDKVFAEINKVLKPWSFMDMMTDNIQH